MKSFTIKAVAIALALAFSGSASAALLCKNSIGQEIRWQKGYPKPVLLANGTGDAFKDAPTEFDVSKDTLCFVSKWVFDQVNLTGLPTVPGLQTYGNNDSANSPGVIYRGDMAKFILENLPAFDGKPATKQDAFDRKP